MGRARTRAACSSPSPLFSSAPRGRSGPTAPRRPRRPADPRDDLRARAKKGDSGAARALLREQAGELRRWLENRRGTPLDGAQIEFWVELVTLHFYLQLDPKGEIAEELPRALKECGRRVLRRLRSSVEPAGVLHPHEQALTRIVRSIVAAKRKHHGSVEKLLRGLDHPEPHLIAEARPMLRRAQEVPQAAEDVVRRTLRTLAGGGSLDDLWIDVPRTILCETRDVQQEVFRRFFRSDSPDEAALFQIVDKHLRALPGSDAHETRRSRARHNAGFNESLLGLAEDALDFARSKRGRDFMRDLRQEICTRLLAWVPSKSPTVVAKQYYRAVSTLVVVTAA